MSANPETDSQGERPKVGEVKPGEPTDREKIEAIQNDPDRDFVVTVGEIDYPLVELTLLSWRKYIAVVAPKFEEVLKSLLPLLTIAIRGFAVWRQLGSDVRNNLRIVAAEGETELLQETLHQMGITDYSYEDLLALQQAAKSGDQLSFLTAMGTIFLRPMAGPALDALRELSFSKLALELDADLPELALASLKSSLLKRKKAVDEQKLEDDINMMDGIDLFEIVYKQYLLYVKRGKIRRFFDQMMLMTTSRSTNTVTPSVATTGTIPS